jgi:hypothetical protein
MKGKKNAHLGLFKKDTFDLAKTFLSASLLENGGEQGIKGGIYECR